MRVLSDGRVRRSEEEWRDLVSQFASSGTSELQFCRRQKISRNAFRSWKRRLDSAPAKPVERTPDFVELTRPRSESEITLAAGEFELALPGGVRLRWKA